MIRGLQGGLKPAAGWSPSPAPAHAHAQRRRAFRITSVSFLTVILLLGSIGVVHGLWAKNLSVYGTVQTGDVNADWSVVFTSDECHDYEASGDGLQILSGGGGDSCACPDGGQTYTFGGDGGGGGDCPQPCPDGGEVQTLGGTTYTGGGGGGYDPPCVVLPGCTATVQDAGVEPHGAQIANVTITNAHKDYWCRVKAVVQNTGSVPFNVIGADTLLDSQNDDGLQFYDLNGSEYGKCDIETYEGDGGGFVQTFGGGYHPPPPPDGGSLQVDPGGEASIECKVIVKDSAQQGWTYYFAIEVCVAQWNEDPSSGDASSDYDACKHSGQHEGPETPVLTAPHETETS